MEFQMIEQSAFEEMKTLAATLRERAERFRELFSATLADSRRGLQGIAHH